MPPRKLPKDQPIVNQTSNPPKIPTAPQWMSLEKYCRESEELKKYFVPLQNWNAITAVLFFRANYKAITDFKEV
jgi:hypothetical protein